MKPYASTLGHLASLEAFEPNKLVNGSKRLENLHDCRKIFMTFWIGIFLGTLIGITSMKLKEAYEHGKIRKEE